MATTLTAEQHQHRLKQCKAGKHKLRENAFGVVWCTNCGLLSTSVGNAKKLEESDKLIIVTNK